MKKQGNFKADMRSWAGRTWGAIRFGDGTGAGVLLWIAMTFDEYTALL
jgi:hypothetical protein